VQTATTEKLLVDVTEAARMLGIGRTLLYEMLVDGRLGPIPITFGRKKLWRTEELRHWVEAACPPRKQWLQLQGDNQ
jgi:excisionase family DNA binding protein